MKKQNKNDLNIKVVNLADTPDKVEIVADWFIDEWQKHYPNQTPKIIAEQIKNNFLNKNSLPFYLIALENDNPLGVIGLRLTEQEGKEDLSPWLSSLYVPLEHRQKGIGSILINALVIVAADMGFDKLYLYTTNSVSYYEKRGWKINCPFVGNNKKQGMIMELNI